MDSYHAPVHADPEGSLEPSLRQKLFHFHGEFSENKEKQFEPPL